MSRFSLAPLACYVQQQYTPARRYTIRWIGLCILTMYFVGPRLLSKYDYIDVKGESSICHVTESQMEKFHHYNNRGQNKVIIYYHPTWIVTYNTKDEKSL
ncbi:unnamed protein product [Didymodactylos carnosus]|uniref:Uncharacterized protein n=1 Tax=Didymodactylos carnosus TaxID=1234261 RepID=A0A814FKQ5_9BILA|nr:unnamed protein product [Didymodactylos carnosus]CAF0984216.1 unnamed protein product [Didymodactylos carnosus]CAF3705864.1 unnamed protein product [Didymodactylos carnosus]CAF3756541.1 unnamed protein product [Didymodactylos carnosus]